MKRLIVFASIAVVLASGVSGCNGGLFRKRGDTCCPCEQQCEPQYEQSYEGAPIMETTPTYIETVPSPTGTLPGPARTTPG